MFCAELTSVSDVVLLNRLRRIERRFYTLYAGLLQEEGVRVPRSKTSFRRSSLYVTIPCRSEDSAGAAFHSPRSCTIISSTKHGNFACQVHSSAFASNPKISFPPRCPQLSQPSPFHFQIPLTPADTFLLHTASFTTFATWLVRGPGLGAYESKGKFLQITLLIPISSECNSFLSERSFGDIEGTFHIAIPFRAVAASCF